MCAKTPHLSKWESNSEQGESFVFFISVISLVLISDIAHTGAPTVILPHPDTLFSPLVRDPTPLTTRMEATDLALWASRRAAIACSGKEAAECCPTQCLPICGTYDPRCEKACTKTCVTQVNAQT